MTKLRWLPGTGGGTEVIPDDWADEKARKWVEETVRCEMKLGSAGFIHDLAALLREVAGSGIGPAWIATRQQTLAEVRRVVEGRRATWEPGDAWAACDEILARLEKL